ncbi:hypothetical protein FNV43_RR08778 [Rhamnella rubrinervis]|uniref:Uncharacterized protein n=1 Tax=Rhamnella rubrinervis TaxID=2594499 RepID=A0A8K0MJP1_9ROSA|nr:hypothetical protein FNV43_RR08778 [Rhamnella rubrinervis]
MTSWKQVSHLVVLVVAVVLMANYFVSCKGTNIGDIGSNHPIDGNNAMESHNLTSRHRHNDNRKMEAGGVISPNDVGYCGDPCAFVLQNCFDCPSYGLINGWQAYSHDKPEGVFSIADIELPQSRNTSKSSTSGTVQKPMLSNARFEVEKFDGTNNFGMWQCEVLDLLFQERSQITLEAEPKDMSNKDWDYINRQACGTIRLCLVKDQKYKHLTTTLLYGKDEVKFVDVSNALVKNKYRKKDQIDHRETTPETLTIARGRTSNRKSEGSGALNRSRSKSRGVSSRRNLAKDECAYCHQKGH